VGAARQEGMLGFQVDVERAVAAIAADAGYLHAAKPGRQLADGFQIQLPARRRPATPGPMVIAGSAIDNCRLCVRVFRTIEKAGGRSCRAA
jgi:hypothetical protein